MTRSTINVNCFPSPAVPAGPQTVSTPGQGMNWLVDENGDFITDENGNRITVPD